jgi:hypothetical protein
MSLPKHDQVVERLAAQRADPSLRVSVLPRRARRDADLPDAQVVHPRVELGAEDGIAISDQRRRHDIRADGLHDLLRGSRGVRVRRHDDVQHTATFEREDEKDVEEVERHRWHRQKVDRDGSREMVAEKCLAGLRRGMARSPG